MVNLSNLNPFKKKENEFKLDDYSIPSLNDASKNNNQDIENPITNINEDFSGLGNSNQLNEINQSNEFNPSNDISNITNQFPQTNNLDSNVTGFSPMGDQNPILNKSNSFGNNQNNANQQIDDINSQINKAKLESVESKVTLIDARLSNIEQKLELLNKLILSEVSDETKRKLNVQNMVKNLR